MKYYSEIQKSELPINTAHTNLTDIMWAKEPREYTLDAFMYMKF